MTVNFNLSSTGLTTVDFTDTTFDFIFADVEYTPVVASPSGDGSIPPYVTETLPVILRGTSHDDMATSMQELAALQKRAAEYWVDQQQATPVWLNCKLYNETGARRALVKAIHYEFRSDIDGIYRDCAAVQDYLIGTVLIERHPYWERTTSRIFPNITPSAAAAVSYDYTATGPQLLSNIGFETAGAGGADIWANWSESAGDGALADEGVIVHGGSHACKQTSGVTSNTVVSQTFTVAPNQVYYWSFYARGDGTNAGRYYIYDLTNAAFIVDYTSTGVTAAAYAAVQGTFTSPASCISVRLGFVCTTVNATSCYFDDAGIWLLAHDIVGDVPARNNGLSWRSGTGGATLTRFWLGLRSADKHGATGISNFQPVWECEDGSNLDAEVTDDGGGTEPNTASPGGGSGDFVKVNPTAGGTDWADGSFHLIFGVNLSQAGYIAADRDDADGRFLCLLRAKMETGTDEWRVRMRNGFGSGPQNYHDPVTITSTSWDYYQLGTITIPSRNKRAIETSVLSVAVDYDSIYLEARQVTGTADLYCDCICLVPVDEGFLHVIETSTDTSLDCLLGEGPGQEQQVIRVDDVGGGVGAIYNNEPFEFEHFRLPTGDGRIICVYARATSSVFTDQIEFADPSIITPGYTERWTALRGAE